MIALSRVPHWPLQLDALLSARLRMPFEWGVFDCTIFAADAVQAITGVDLAAQHRGYRGVRPALRLLAQSGGVAALASRMLGEPVSVQHARVGDIVLVSADNRGRDALGVVITHSAVALPGGIGLIQIPLSLARHRWAVG